MFNYRWRLLELSALRLLSASVLMRQLILAFERIGKARIAPVGSALIDIDRLPGLPFSSEVANGPPPNSFPLRCTRRQQSHLYAALKTNMYIAGGSRFQLRICALHPYKLD
jgi:hypothetical protein